ncbi:MAG TPA: glycosyltransferase [Acidimicrobiales bacterium]|nr:glycosyltransferase [Acidimicrobiales bacterium]
MAGDENGNPQRTVVLVPRRAGLADRDRLWEFARSWWANDFPDWAIVEGHHEIGPFNRSKALNDAARSAGDWDVAVLIDADVLAHRDTVRTAVDVAAATNRMVLAYHERIHLSQRGTERVLAGFDGNWKQSGMVHRVFLDSCSSAVVVSRKLWDDVGGFDEKFSGWGWEDVAFRIACETISGHPMVQLAAPLFHLHHRVSSENNTREATYQANKARGDRYRAAHWDVGAVRQLIDEPDPVEVPVVGPTRIPRILHRTVPETTTPQVEAWWDHFRMLHPGWDLRTYRDPLDPANWPETGDLWELCQSGAQRAGLIRLEALWRWGGVYVDSDVEPYRSLEPLLHLPAFAAWEDAKVVPDAVLASEPGHPAFRLMLDRARASITAGAKAWESGPGVTTAVLPGRHDVLLLPPGSFFPYHYSEKQRRREDHFTAQPWAFAAHHWHHSWKGK